MEAYEKMLDTWMDLVTNMKDLPVEVLFPQSQEVFNTYVQCHISAPEGTRIQVNHLNESGVKVARFWYWAHVIVFYWRINKVVLDSLWISGGEIF